ncbi:MAG: PilT/PilU family type 4a pilus ATPase [Azospira sp.]|nr:PilT/PilU family type 4a pilus ATPase [Azospira sp.]
MILDKVFRLMAEKRASDIFISAGAPIYIKIQGMTQPVNRQVMTPAMIEQIAADLMTTEQAKAFVEKKEMNLSLGVTGLGNFRINLFRQRASIAIVVRYVLGVIPALDSLGLPPVLADLIMEKRGLILVTGSTGSGKSTTIASMLDHRNANRGGHILTIEDPIEYLFQHKKSVVNQRELGMDTEDWESALKNAMRQAPDCILIGEIRDRETMQAAIAYAQTGHLCLGTLHANNSHHALNRIINFFPLENRDALYLDLAVVLRAVVSQRLVSKPEGLRVPACEVLLNTRHIAELIGNGDVPAIREAMEHSLAPGSQTFEQSLFNLYRQDTISLDEALAHADSPTNLSWLINNSGFVAQATKDGGCTVERAPVPDTEGRPLSFDEFTLDLADTGKDAHDARTDTQ